MREIIRIIFLAIGFGFLYYVDFKIGIGVALISLAEILRKYE